MKKTITQHQYSDISRLYLKLKNRLAKRFKNGSFHQLGKTQQRKLLLKIEKLEAQLTQLRSGLKYAGAALMLGGILFTSESQAQFATNGTEFQVNTYTSNHQEIPSVAMDADGDFVVVWESYGQDGGFYDNGVYAQRYNAAGTAQGVEFLVNTHTTSKQRRSAVAMDSDGDFVVVWDSYNQDGDDTGIFGQRYNAGGVAQGGEFQVNTYTTGSQRYAAIAMDSDGDFVITWISDGQDGDGNSIHAQRYNAGGAPQGSEFQVNTYTAYDQKQPSIAMDSDGDFVIVWQSYDQDGDYNGIYGQRYNASGATQGTEFQVNTHTTHYQEIPSVAMDSDGDFVVVWQSYDQDGDEYGVYGQRYNALGVSQGSEFLVNTYTSNYQYSASVTMDSDGDFVVVWESYDQDGDGYGIYGQRYNALGAAQGTEFRINTVTSASQSYASVAMDADGDFVVAWNSYGQDGDEYGVFAQRYTGGFPTGVLNSTFNNSLELYPSPAKGEVKVNLEGTADVRLLDLAGHEVSSQTISSNTINLSGIKSGIYMVEIMQGEQKALKKLVVE